MPKKFHKKSWPLKVINGSHLTNQKLFQETERGAVDLFLPCTLMLSPSSAIRRLRHDLVSFARLKVRSAFALVGLSLICRERVAKQHVS